MGKSHANDVQCWLPGVRDRENRRSGTVKRCRGCSRAQKAHQLRIYPWLPRGVPAPSITAFVFSLQVPRYFLYFTVPKFRAIWARFGAQRSGEIFRDLGAIWVQTRENSKRNLGGTCAKDSIRPNGGTAPGAPRLS